MNYYTGVLKKYAVFNGRAARTEYWMFVLLNLIVSIIVGMVASMLGDTMGIVGIVYALAVLVPSIAVAARRLHDTGRSGWWQLIALIPIIGAIWLIVLLCLDSNQGDNKYGANPKVVVTPVV
jgi:uncharacterized membrane protein YhaH (DUF805 family)